jgi:hypothetical protein
MLDEPVQRYVDIVVVLGAYRIAANFTASKRIQLPI